MPYLICSTLSHSSRFLYKLQKQKSNLSIWLIKFQFKFQIEKNVFLFNNLKTFFKTIIYNLDQNNLINKVSLDAPDMNSEGTITLATNANSVVFSGVCIWGNVVSFRAENVAIAYR